MSKTEGAGQSVRPKRANRKIIIWIVAGVASLLVIAYLAVGAVAASQLTLPKRVFDPALNPGAFGLVYEEIRFPARNDGLQIAGWYIPSEQNEHAIILVHGRDNSRTNGFCDLFVPFAKALHEAGFSVLLIDLRGHGESADSRYTFGLKERWDVLGAVDWLETRGYQPGKIGVLGYSLGAGSVIGAASEEPAIGAIWTDSAFADIKSVIERNWVAESGLPKALLYSAEAMIRLMYGFDITASRPIDDIGKIAPRPIFMAHCQADNMIPISHLDRLLSVAQDAQTWVIPVCDQNTIGKELVPEKYNNHAIGYCVQPDEYSQRVIQFFDDNLK